MLMSVLPLYFLLPYNVSVVAQSFEEKFYALWLAFSFCSPDFLIHLFSSLIRVPNISQYKLLIIFSSIFQISISSSLL